MKAISFLFEATQLRKYDHCLPRTTYGGGNRLPLGIMAALRPRVKPQIVRGSSSSSDTSQTDVLKLSTTGGNPEAVTLGCAEESRARS